MPVDTRCDRRDNATTEHSADSPERPATRPPRLGLSRDGERVRGLFETICERWVTVPGERELLLLILEHVADGGIVIEHAGEFVLTWSDGGVSRRLCPKDPEV